LPKIIKKKKYTNYHELLLEELQDPKLALAYLNEALMEEDQRVFLLALKDVLEAQGGDMSAIATEAKLNRQNLYRMLSKKGNPRWDSLASLFNVLGLTMQLTLKRK
jgi:probable addiction module antidote protein